MTEREVPLVDVTRVHAERVEGRRVVYLDTNVWIALSHANSERAKECLAACKAARDADEVVFPVSYAAIKELFKQNSSPSQMARCELMDELSAGLTFRNNYAIREVETPNAMRVLIGHAPEPTGRSMMFSYVLEAFGSTSVSFAPGWTDEMIAAYVAHCWSTGAVSTIKWQLQHLDLDAHRAKQICKEQADRQRFQHALDAAIGHHKTKTGKPDRAAALREEQYWFFKNVVLLRLVALATEKQVEAIKDRAKAILQGENNALLAQVIEGMPSLAIESCLLAHGIMNPSRPYKAEDSWDLEHAAVPFAYSDAFCTRDGGLRDAIRISGASRHSGCAMLGDIDELQRYVETGTSNH